MAREPTTHSAVWHLLAALGGETGWRLQVQSITNGNQLCLCNEAPTEFLKDRIQRVTRMARTGRAELHASPPDLAILGYTLYNKSVMVRKLFLSSASCSSK